MAGGGGGSPFGSAFGLAGLGVSLYGDFEAMGAAKQISDISKAEAGVEEQQNTVRMQAMQMSAHRQMLQQVRNAQAARSMALSTGTSQGAQFSSGLQGAFGNIAGQAGSNIGSISQGLQSGMLEFGLTQQLDALKMSMAGAQSNLASAQGISAIGSGISNAGKSFG